VVVVVGLVELGIGMMTDTVGNPGVPPNERT
jgi:hypothetical protein